MKELQTLSVVSPGFFGLNTQESGITLSPNFAQLTDNVVIDKFGRLGSRKGWLMKTDSGATTLSNNSVQFLMEHVNADNTSVVISGAINKLFKNGVDIDVLADITPASYTITSNDWKGASLYDHALIVQRNHEPIVYSEGATTDCNTIYEHFIEKLQVDDSVATFDDLPEVPLVNDRYLTVDAYQVWEWDGSAWVNITPTVIASESDLIDPPALDYYITKDDLVFGWNGTEWVDSALPSVTLVADLSASAADGDLYIVTDTNEVYRWNGTEWVDSALPSVTLVADLPASAADGDLYIVTDTNKVYRWNGTEWVDSALPSVTLVADLPASTADGDLYIVTDTNEVYRWDEATSAWVLQSFESLTQQADLPLSPYIFLTDDTHKLFEWNSVDEVWEDTTPREIASPTALPPLPTSTYLVEDENKVYELRGVTWTDISPVFSFGISYPRDVIAAYGRFWVHDGNTIFWSTDIADVNFPAFNGGTSGTLNISSVLPNNVDTIVALASHNGFLIIFCEDNIVVYKGAENPLGDFKLSDVITGVGCVARDSIAYTGGDLIFLSDTGVRSLGRVIQEKSLPMRDLTKNVRDDLLKDVVQEKDNNNGLNKVKAVYSEINAFYLLSFPSTSTIYCLDMRQPLEDGSARVTQWYTYEAASLLRMRDRRLFIGKTNGIGLYTGSTDNGESFRLRYFSHYLDMQSPTQLKILKQIKATVIGGSNQSFVIKAGFDFSTASRSYPFTIVDLGVSEFGVAEYGISEFSFGINLDSIKSSVGGSGNVIQIGFEADVNGSELSVQKLDIFIKTGRIS